MPDPHRWDSTNNEMVVLISAPSLSLMQHGTTISISARL